MSTTPHVVRPAPKQAYSPAVLQSRLTDPRRLEALRASALLDGAQNPVLDRLTRLVTRFLGVPVSLVTLVGDGGQHFPGLTGLSGWAGERRGTPLTHSFCQHVVGRDETLVIQDAAIDPLVMSNLAFSELGVVAYLGVPLRTSSGDTLGALCA
ncbi:MAG: GAF domain-containing protein, partial [Cryobacterium sp.]|nr:GAF domain-containing protein [Cryobacterium sp.]